MNGERNPADFRRILVAILVIVFLIALGGGYATHAILTDSEEFETTFSVVSNTSVSGDAHVELLLTAVGSGDLASEPASPPVGTTERHGYPGTPVGG